MKHKIVLDSSAAVTKGFLAVSEVTRQQILLLPSPNHLLTPEVFCERCNCLAKVISDVDQRHQVQRSDWSIDPLNIRSLELFDDQPRPV
ncbi:hypothetical protein TNCV_64271 [Trichonephila clavipes]|nr:hypothetical protein TNCV_64271 [Trichonephila clavipes]